MKTTTSIQKEAKKNSNARFLVDPEEEIRQRIYAITEHWLSDLKFFKDELSFFGRLLSQHLMWLNDEECSSSLRLLSSKIANLENKRSMLDQNLIVHRKRLSLLLENPFGNDSQKEKDSHGSLETSFADFVKEFRRIKKEAFSQIEKVIDAERDKANAIM